MVYKERLKFRKPEIEGWVSASLPEVWPLQRVARGNDRAEQGELHHLRSRGLPVSEKDGFRNRFRCHMAKAIFQVLMLQTESVFLKAVATRLPCWLLRLSFRASGLCCEFSVCWGYAVALRVIEAGHTRVYEISNQGQDSIILLQDLHCKKKTSILASSTVATWNLVRVFGSPHTEPCFGVCYLFSRLNAERSSRRGIFLTATSRQGLIP